MWHAKALLRRKKRITWSFEFYSKGRSWFCWQFVPGITIPAYICTPWVLRFNQIVGPLEKPQCDPQVSSLVTKIRITEVCYWFIGLGQIKMLWCMAALAVFTLFWSRDPVDGVILLVIGTVCNWDYWDYCLSVVILESTKENNLETLYVARLMGSRTEM